MKEEGKKEREGGRKRREVGKKKEAEERVKGGGKWKAKSREIERGRKRVKKRGEKGEGREEEGRAIEEGEVRRKRVVKDIQVPLFDMYAFRYLKKKGKLLNFFFILIYLMTHITQIEFYC